MLGPKAARLQAPILALTACAFAIGTAEFVIAGLLPDVARDLSVSIPAAGQLVTAYAAGVVLGAPTLAVATARMERKSVILAMLVIFIVGNLLSALATNYATLMAARVVAALAHGSLFGVGVVVATALAPEGRRGSAVALLFSGLTIANLVGVPFGTFIGQIAGWRATFAAITALGVLSLAATAAFIPSVAGGGAIDLKSEFTVAARPKVLLALATTVANSACVFALFTYIVPTLEDVSGWSPRAVTIILFVVGVGFTIGISLGGRLADRGVIRALIVALSGLMLFSFAFALLSPRGVAAVAAAFMWGVSAFATVAPLQTRVLDAAREAPNVASTLNVGAFNFGNALGAFLGGAVIGLGLGPSSPAIAAGAIALCGLGLALAAAALDRRVAARRGSS